MLTFTFRFLVFGFLPEHMYCSPFSHFLVYFPPPPFLYTYIWLYYIWILYNWISYIWISYIFGFLPEHIVHLFVFLIFGLYPSATPHHPLCLVMTRIRAAIAQNPPRQFITHYVRARIFKV